WEAYAELIPPEFLVQTKAQTYGVEWNNFRQRHWFGRFRRETCIVRVVSKWSISPCRYLLQPVSKLIFTNLNTLYPVCVVLLYTAYCGLTS
ncbi:MAG: hypothetical protein LBC12_06930, partial [Nitrososphaerota archaeon]|nr:hypothetical protein [Nitrososphaerota archaeon]